MDAINMLVADMDVELGRALLVFTVIFVFVFVIVAYLYIKVLPSYEGRAERENAKQERLIRREERRRRKEKKRNR